MEEFFELLKQSLWQIPLMISIVILLGSHIYLKIMYIPHEEKIADAEQEIKEDLFKDGYDFGEIKLLCVMMWGEDIQLKDNRIAKAYDCLCFQILSNSNNSIWALVRLRDFEIQYFDRLASWKELEHLEDSASKRNELPKIIVSLMSTVHQVSQVWDKLFFKTKK